MMKQESSLTKAGAKAMNALEHELQEAQRKYEEKVAELQAKHNVIQQLGEFVTTYHEPAIGSSKLYGSVGYVNFDGCEYESIRHGKNPDRELLAYLLAKFPPVERQLVADGCKSFRPVTAEVRGNATLTPVDPVTVRIEVFQRQTAGFEWYAEINGALWRFRVSFPLYSCSLGQLDIKTRDDHRTGSVIEYERCDFTPTSGSLAQRIKWAAGSREYPNSFTLWWHKGDVERSAGGSVVALSPKPIAEAVSSRDAARAEIEKKQARKKGNGGAQ